MIGSLSEQIAKWLKSKKIIEAEDVDVCGYGIFWLLNIIEFLLVSVILGTVLRILPGALAFFISFLFIYCFIVKNSILVSIIIFISLYCFRNAVFNFQCYSTLKPGANSCCFHLLISTYHSTCCIYNHLTNTI